MSDMHATLRIDTVTPTVDDARPGQEGRSPFVFVHVGWEMALWGYDPAAFRRLALALGHAADALEAERRRVIGELAGTTPARGKE